MRPSTAQRLRDIAPFALATSLPFVLLPLPGGGGGNAAAWVLGGVLTVVLLGAIVLAPWERMPAWTALAPALAYLGILSLLREAGGGNESGLGPLVLVPVIWLALYGRRRELAITVVGVALVYWVPILLSSDDGRYPSSGWRIGALLSVLAAIVGFTVQELHDRERRHARQLRDLAHTDELTGLPNRRAFDAALVKALADAKRRNASVCVGLLDVDRFKAVNDVAGHHGGDETLVRLTGAWQAEIRLGDTLARTGGDEFVVLLPNCALDGAGPVVERMRAVSTGVTCSIGVAEWNGEEDAASLVRRADIALYAAKRAGRDRVGYAPFGAD